MLFDLFGFGGRLGRLSFLLHGIAGVVLVTAGMIVLVGMTVTAQPSSAAIVAPLVLGMALISWSVLAITAKRLHDLDLSGWHAVWIFALNLLSPGLHAAGGFMATFVALFSCLTWLFLLLTPGSDGGGTVEPATRPSRAANPIDRLNLGRR